MSDSERGSSASGQIAKNSRCILSGKYRHYKGGEYEVIGTAIHSETEEIMVVYRPLYGEQNLWVRPFDMFTEKLMIDSQSVLRFEFIGKIQSALERD